MGENISIGDFDVRILLFKTERVQSDTGAPAKIKTEVANVWAAKSYSSTTKDLENRVIAENVVEFVVYWQPAIANENIQDLIVESDGEIFEIFGFNPIGRREFFKLKCQLRE